jgi:hypothetical protein
MGGLFHPQEHAPSRRRKILLLVVTEDWSLNTSSPGLGSRLRSGQSLGTTRAGGRIQLSPSGDRGVAVHSVAARRPPPAARRSAAASGSEWRMWYYSVTTVVESRALAQSTQFKMKCHNVHQATASGSRP